MTIKGKTYSFIKDYRKDERYRQSFNHLSRKVFGLDFEEWYKQGFWTEKYSPYSLVFNNNVVANISVNTMEFAIEGKPVNAIQLGTVMTDPDFRNQGLSKALMECVLNDLRQKQQLIYLYANDSVTEFYPRFGFAKAKEYNYSGMFSKDDRHSFYKLNIGKTKDRDIIMRLTSNTIPVSRISMVNNLELLMFYLISFMSDNIYYSKKLDLVAVVEFEDQDMRLIDVFCERSFNLEEIISSLITKDSMKVYLGFTPWEDKDYQIDLIDSDDTFFVLNGSFDLEGRFPMLSQA